MKLTKKIIAAVAALSLTMASTATVFAEDTITGGAEYLNTTIYKVTLPTTAGITFTLDPQGLLSANPGDDLTTLSGAGDVSSSGVMVAYSESSVDVKCKASFYVDAPETLAVSDAAAITSATNTTKAAVGLQINYASKDNGSYASDVSGATIATVSSPSQLDVTATSVNAASVISPTLAKVDYVVTGNATDGFDYIKKTEDEASILYMYVGGKVTTKADWSDYTGADSIKLKAVFTFTKVDGGDLAKDVYAMLDVKTASMWISDGTNTVSPVAFPAGTVFTNVKANGNDCAFTTNMGYLIISQQQLTAAGAFSSPLTVTFNANGKAYTTTVTF